MKEPDTEKQACLWFSFENNMPAVNLSPKWLCHVSPAHLYPQKIYTVCTRLLILWCQHKCPVRPEQGPDPLRWFNQSVRVHSGHHTWFALNTITTIYLALYKGHEWSLVYTFTSNLCKLMYRIDSSLYWWYGVMWYYLFTLLISKHNFYVMTFKISIGLSLAVKSSECELEGKELTVPR